MPGCCTDTALRLRVPFMQKKFATSFWTRDLDGYKYCSGLPSCVAERGDARGCCTEEYFSPVLYGDGTKLSRTRVSEQQFSMEIAQILAVTRFGATVLYGHQGPVPHPGPRSCQCCFSKRVQEDMIVLKDDFFWPSTSPLFSCIHLFGVFVARRAQENQIFWEMSS